jgi:O-antigen ligase
VTATARQAVGHAGTRGRSSAAAPVLVVALVGFLVLEYLRPPLLQALHLQMVFLVVLPLLWFASRERPWSRNLTLQTLFLIAGAVTMPFAHNGFVVYNNLRYMYAFLVTALAVTWLLPRRKTFRRVVWIWVGIMCFQAFWALTHQGRGYGSFLGDENDLALACSMGFAFAFLGFRWLRGAKRWLCGGAALLLLSGVVASFSRGGFLGLAAVAIYSLLAGGHRVRNLLIGGSLAGILYFSLPAAYKTEMSTIQETSSGTAEMRLFLWVTATRMWLDHPIFGVGPENAAYLLGRYQPPPTKGGMFSARHFQERVWGMTALHSVYFQVLAERGLVGVLLFSWMAVSFYATMRRLRRDAPKLGARSDALVRDAILYALALEAAMAGFLVAGGFLSMLHYPYFWFFTALAVAHDRAIRREHAARAARALPREPASGPDTRAAEELRGPRWGRRSGRVPY